jgi:hypothetical protein
VHLVLDQRSVQILLDALVQIGVHGLCFFFDAHIREPGRPPETLQALKAKVCQFSDFDITECSE